MVAQCYLIVIFNLHFSDSVWAAFHVLICHSFFVIGKMSVHRFCQFFIMLLVLSNYQSSLYWNISSEFDGYISCKYFLPVYILSFHFLNGVFWGTEICFWWLRIFKLCFFDTAQLVKTDICRNITPAYNKDMYQTITESAE